ncbi:carboxylate--amine ligase [Sphingomonas sp. H39-1-10]|uniref:carboxylate--amine ligase n=1 Tax=Sphingomonas pollutisoli TaxID=3030829 RepID=UPI0023B8C2C5|nr:carboxylate--amine ligase [Sphingomonas pollutisoli]MDF0488737.1 carboxylate--amine ligase [Sphingomonas pollutisoli]
MTRPYPLPPAIVLGVDTAIGLTVVRELGRFGVPGVAIGRSAYSVGGASRYCTRFVSRPRDRAPADWLPDLIAETGAAALFAISEGDLLDLSHLPERIGSCRVLTPRKAKLDIVLDKLKTLEAARAVGILTPESWQPQPGEPLAERAAALAYPVVLKWGDPPAMFARLDAAGIAFEKAEYARTPDELLGRLARYEALGAYPLVQTWVGGYGFGQMLMMADGVARLRFQHRRVREFPASGGVSTLCATVPADQHREQMAKSEALLTGIGWEGPAMVEYRHDPATGRYWLMEINGRFWGSLPLASQAGAYFAWEQYRHAVLGEPADARIAYRPRRARYAIPDTKRLVQIVRDPDIAGAGRPPFSRSREAASYLAEFLNPRTGYYIWSWSDPKPLLRDVAGVLAKLKR